jgi:hypothetical protein
LIAVNGRARIDARQAVYVDIHIRYVVKVNIAIDRHVARASYIYDSLVVRIVPPLHGDAHLDISGWQINQPAAPIEN